MAGYSTPAWNNNAAPAIDASALTAVGQAIELAQHPFGTCSTAAATQAKTVTIDFSGTLTIYEGLRIFVYFRYENRAPYPTLSVNGTTANYVWQNGYPVLGTPAGSWHGDSVVEMVFTNGRWNIVGTSAMPTMFVAYLSSSAWSVASGVYSQSVSSLTWATGTISADPNAGYIGTRTKVDVEPDSTVIQQLVNDGVSALYIANNNGYLTAYAVGAAPTADLTVPVLLSEIRPYN